MGLFRILLFGFLAVPFGQSALAAPVAPIQVTLSQADGTTFQARPRGNEYVSWMETLDGYSIAKKDNDWHYAVHDAEGKLVPGPNKVVTPAGPSQAPPAFDPRQGMQKHLRPPLDAEALPRHVPRRLNVPKGTQAGADLLGGGGAQSAPASGDGASLATESGTAPSYAPAEPIVQPVLTLLVSFSDRSFNYTDASFQDLMYGASQSVRDYFLETSYDNFVLDPASESQGTADDGVVAVTLGYNHPNPGSNSASAAAIAVDAYAAADAYVDYSLYDADLDGSISAKELAIVIILSGYENAYGGGGAPTPRVWGHQYFTAAQTHDGVALSPYCMFGEIHYDHQATIGIMAHELAHLTLDLPDLYDRDGSSEGIGDWGLMGSGSWNKYLHTEGTSPAHLCAWSKVATGLVTPDDIEGDVFGQVVYPANATASVKRLWIDPYGRGEYFLVENRYGWGGYDLGLPGSGLIVWHVDPTAPSQNDDESHKLVDLEAADGLTDLDDLVNKGDGGDPYPGTSASTVFADTTTPNSKDYAGTTTDIVVQNIDDSIYPDVSADFLTTIGLSGDWIGYDEEGYSGGWGYGADTIWTALRITNDTAMDTLDGIEVYARANGSTVDFYLYDSIAAGILGTQLYSETGLAASAGWNRFMLAAPQSFPPFGERVMVLRIVSPGSGYPAAIDGSGVNSGRSYYDSNGVGTFSSLAYDLNQHVLLSSSNVSPTAVDDAASADYGTLVNINVVGNDTDSDGSIAPTTVAVVSAPANGTAVAKPDGTVDYTPDPGFLGSDSFTYTVQDDAGATSNEATVEVTVSCPYQPVRVTGGGAGDYADIASANAAAADGDLILLQSLDFTESPIFDRNVDVTLSGGYLCGFGESAEKSIINGSLTVSNGRVSVDKLIVR